MYFIAHQKCAKAQTPIQGKQIHVKKADPKVKKAETVKQVQEDTK